VARFSCAVKYVDIVDGLSKRKQGKIANKKNIKTMKRG
jgi:hypothetical protein